MSEERAQKFHLIKTDK
ncbi:hypothetical protein CGLO_15180 [Colletotrichum gloeosporioides Cg-14]|uniref:Uncharacterized protein n=1 Tax=Colletotrichum gloeosporioides (strain Cg-14) TaxID=1237896 RepID=T0K2C8_COLGC|nr:hypothetical protein CGLO_15180 [Colletotrichum gloeosporioides Cg-14]